ncbi:hypothetical protein [Streptomyces sp. B1I3]|nr:hypothetical protein [Streptomyces sp. B1I3]MDQ0791675.1 hypothetical protein [Streptomyces sp. B1I3]
MYDPANPKRAAEFLSRMPENVKGRRNLLIALLAAALLSFVPTLIGAAM